MINMMDDYNDGELEDLEEVILEVDDGVDDFEDEEEENAKRKAKDKKKKEEL